MLLLFLTCQIRGAWILLHHLAPYAAEHISPSFALKYWKKIRNSKQEKEQQDTEGNSSTSLHVLNVLGCVASSLGEKRQGVVDDVVSQLLAYDVEPMKIQAYVQVLVRLCHNKKELIRAWSTKLFDSCVEVGLLKPLADSIRPCQKQSCPRHWELRTKCRHLALHPLLLRSLIGIQLFHLLLTT